MNWIDLLVLIPICWWGFKGFCNGLIYEVFTILALIIGFWAARHFSHLLQVWINIEMAGPIAFIITFFIVLFLVHLVGKAMQSLIQITLPDIIDHLLGLVFGVCKVIVGVSVIFYLLNMVDKKEILIKKETKENSFAYKFIEPVVPKLLIWKEDWQDKDTNN
ncbi:MAG: CvpA family protein [Bacteroidales bacterium]|nr:CvpA family protein [Bacteroidales bacterium]